MREKRPNPTEAKTQGATEKLVKQLAEYPYLKERLEAILEIVEQEGSGACQTADEAELALIEEMRRLGQGALTEWARKGQAKAVEQVRAEHPGSRRHSKKN
jgi:hypothetical protein